MKKYEIPVWEKLLLTIDETVAYTNIGREKLMELIEETDCDFVIQKGTHKLINRKKFENYIDQIRVL